MFSWRKREEAPLDPAVGPIEELLETASARHPAGPWPERTLHVAHLCACYAMDDSPDWMIWGTESGVGWRRWPIKLPEREVVHAPREVGCHTEPTLVLAWLRGEAPVPWPEAYASWGDPEVWTELQHRISAP
jgi:hypothetical protein